MKYLKQFPIPVNSIIHISYLLVYLLTLRREDEQSGLFHYPIFDRKHYQPGSISYTHFFNQPLADTFN